MKKFFTIACLFIFMNNSFANEELSQQATAFYSDNNFQKTQELILQIPENKRTENDWLLLGNVLDDQGDKDSAIFMYRKAIVVNPKFYKAYYNLANNYTEKDQYNMAIENYNKAISLSKENPYIYYNLACVYMKKGDFNKAKTNLNKAIMYKNDVPEFHYNLAYIYKKLGKDKLAQTYLDNYNKLVVSQ